MNPAPEYRITYADLRDVTAIRRLMQSAFNHHDAYSPLTIAWLLLRPGNINIKALDPTGQLIGHIAGSPFLLSSVGWIVTLSVDPNHWRQGIGRQLLANCENRLRPPTVRLTVRASNTRAIALYQQAGYHQARTLQRYYRGGEDGLVMEKHRAAT